MLTYRFILPLVSSISIACVVDEDDLSDDAAIAASTSTSAELDESDSDAAAAEPEPPLEFDAAFDPDAAFSTCGFICPPLSIQVGSGCSTGCPGFCPNVAVCAPIPPPPPSASITADPSNVTVAPGALGTTRVCWDTQGLNYPVWIRVTVDGAPGQLFTKESDSGRACENAGWIQPNHTYAFRIHQSNSDASPFFDAVTVTGIEGPATPPGGGGLGCLAGQGCPDGSSCHCGDRCRPSGSICP